MKLIVTEDQHDLIIQKQMDEEYPLTWDVNHFKMLRSFAKRVKYCQENLQRISSGSSRIVYKIDDTKVLKLAKNQKGIAQDEIEIQWKDDGYYGEILANVLDFHPDALWVEMELARKVTPTNFKTIMGFPFDEYSRFIMAEIKYTGAMKEAYMKGLKFREQLDESEFVNKIISFMHDNGNGLDGIGDFARFSTYGIVQRDGKDTVVVIDFGLTSDVYDSYYR
jgi:mRNA-degrading endonuclease RelE of RelBE toxin-antitoxin system